ncbi:MAG: tRNA-dihydrouridine synthase family protein, partial [Chloroflexota bacterium]|nr:tRNA-dihydrouridine synthase family protein [Chloroflexota bacterium]
MPLSPTFHIGPIPIHGDTILAPMDGFSDWPLRSLCRQFGSAMSYTEFIKSKDLIQRPNVIAHRLHYDKSEHPIALQLYGDDVDIIVKAALRAQGLGADIVDINMGCSFKTIANRGAGVGLMRTPSKVVRIFRELSAALDVPISAKIRLGWDNDSRNYLEIARIIAENGGALIAIHARTKRQAYSGKADWDAITAVVEAVDIPVIGNGDIENVADIDRMMCQTGCDAVMIGRAAIGNPWIFARIERDAISP